MKKLLLSALVVLSYSGYAQSSDPYEECLDKAGVSSDGVIELCAEKASGVYKKSITSSYNLIYNAYQQEDASKAKQFEDAQKAWLVNRNKNCELSDNKQYCLMSMNKQRAEELLQKSDKLQEDDIHSDSGYTIKSKQISLFDKEIRGKESKLTYSFTSVDTGISWLNAILLKTISPDGKTTDLNKVKKLIESDFNKFKSDSFNGESAADIYVIHNISYVGKKADFAVFNYHIEAYYGGNYTIDDSIPLYVNLNTKKLISLNDVFSSAGLNKVKDLLWKEFQNSEAGDPEFKERFELSNNFSISKTGITFKYSQGSIAPSVYGPLEYSLPLDKIKTFVKDDAKSLFGISE